MAVKKKKKKKKVTKTIKTIEKDPKLHEVIKEDLNSKIMIEENEGSGRL